MCVLSRSGRVKTIPHWLLELISQIIPRVPHGLAHSYVSNPLTPFEPDSTLRSLGRALLSDAQSRLKTKRNPFESMCVCVEQPVHAAEAKTTAHLII